MPSHSIATIQLVADSNSITLIVSRFNHHRISLMINQAMHDYALGLLTKAQLLSIVHRLDRISGIVG